MIELTTQEKINNVIIWVEHLPEYKQGKDGDLYSIHTQGYCCLGVANHLLGMDQDYDHLPSMLGIFSLMGQAKNIDVLSEQIQYGPQNKLAYINDIIETADFYTIQELLATHPENFFEEAVAEGVRAHFEANPL